MPRTRKRTTGPGRPTAHIANTSHIDPSVVYTRAGVITASGVSATRLALLAAEGIKPNWFSLGRRQFVSGADFVAFMKRAAEHEAAKKAREAEIAAYGD
ncbi:hypothetical protein [Botrimarina sp.]|uniref:hypothetical protein n=1 Tax=Botrimarina sp. TaxID=2795802 RepID=UPI0032EE876C